MISNWLIYFIEVAENVKLVMLICVIIMTTVLVFYGLASAMVNDDKEDWTEDINIIKKCWLPC